MAQEPGDVLLLVDGHALIHRGYHALPPLSTKTGEPTNAVFGFARMLFRAIADLKPRYVAVAFDLSGPTFRHREYGEYKANRAHLPDDLIPQFDRVRELVRTLGMPIFEVEGFEADDVLGTLARQAVERGVEVVIATGDADAMQLVEPKVRVLTPQRGFSETQLFDEYGVKERYGVTPLQIPDFKALKGDSSDNIKGVPGIGEKTAIRLLGEFGSLEKLLEQKEKLPAKLQTIMTENADNARRDLMLATIVRDVPIELDLAACALGQYDRPKIVDLLRELEFNSLLSRLPEAQLSKSASARASQSASEPSALPTPLVGDGARQMSLFGDSTEGLVTPPPIRSGAGLGDYRIIATKEALDELIRQIERVSSFVVDVETTSVDAMRAELVGIAIAIEEGVAHYIPVGHQAGGQLALDYVREKLGPIFADPKKGKLGHNLKYDIIVLDQHGMPVQGVHFDTMVAVYLLESSQRALNLKDVVFSQLGIEMTPITELIGPGSGKISSRGASRGKKTQITMAEVPIEPVASYAGADADMTLRLAHKLEPELKAADLWKLFTDVEMPLVSVLAAMEETGVALDVPFLKLMSVELGKHIASLEAGIFDAAGRSFNINSTHQLAQVLFNELGLPSARKTKTGHSTDAETLEALRTAHPIVGLILDHRQLVKLRSTYVDALPALINPKTGRVHTSFNQTGATTGRLSSSDPNLQNIPIRTEIGHEVRRAFIAGGEGCSLLGADYSQIELRILAHVTQDAQLVAAFAADEDIHASTASQLFGVPIAQVNPDQRRIAKTTNFGVLYGISDYGLSVQLGISRRDAAGFIQQYFAKYPTIRKYLDEQINHARRYGYVTTLLGRRRTIADINAANAGVRNGAERMAINTPIQGTAADIIKIAMIRLHEELQKGGFESKMILQVHDELVLEGPDEEMKRLRPLVAKTMEQAMELSVPVNVTPKTGKNWRVLE